MLTLKNIYQFKSTNNIISEKLPFLAGHTPSASTFHRVFSELDVEKMKEILAEWMKSIVNLEEGEGIAIDGKAIGNTELYLVYLPLPIRPKQYYFRRIQGEKGKNEYNRESDNKCVSFRES